MVRISFVELIATWYGIYQLRRLHDICTAAWQTNCVLALIEPHLLLAAVSLRSHLAYLVYHMPTLQKCPYLVYHMPSYSDVLATTPTDAILTERDMVVLLVAINGRFALCRLAPPQP